MLYQQRQVAAQALRVGISYVRWAMIISTISGGNPCDLRESLGVSKSLRADAPSGLAFERFQMALTRRSIPTIEGGQ